MIDLNYYINSNSPQPKLIICIFVINKIICFESVNELLI